MELANALHSSRVNISCGTAHVAFVGLSYTPRAPATNSQPEYTGSGGGDGGGGEGGGEGGVGGVGGGSGGGSGFGGGGVGGGEGGEWSSA